MENLNIKKDYFYIVINGANNNIIVQLHSSANNIYQNNSRELKEVKYENEYLKKEVILLKKQLENAQNLLDKALNKN